MMADISFGNSMESTEIGEPISPMEGKSYELVVCEENYNGENVRLLFYRDENDGQKYLHMILGGSQHAAAEYLHDKYNLSSKFSKAFVGGESPFTDHRAYACDNLIKQPISCKGGEFFGFYELEDGRMYLHAIDKGAVKLYTIIEYFMETSHFDQSIVSHLVQCGLYVIYGDEFGW